MVKKKLEARDGGLDIHQERILRALQNGKELTLADVAREVGFRSGYSREWLETVHHLKKSKLVTTHKIHVHKITILGKRKLTTHEKGLRSTSK